MLTVAIVLELPRPNQQEALLVRVAHQVAVQAGLSDAVTAWRGECESPDNHSREGKCRVADQPSALAWCGADEHGRPAAGVPDRFVVVARFGRLVEHRITVGARSGGACPPTRLSTVWSFSLFSIGLGHGSLFEQFLGRKEYRRFANCRTSRAS